jgi:uncharacterized membrane protein
MVTAETLLGKVVRLAVAEHYYRPGMGVVASIVIIFLVGMLLRALMMRKLFEWGTGLLYRIPIVKTVYGAFRDLMHFISASGTAKDDEKQVVMVRVGEPEIEIMGFVTRRDFKGLPPEIGRESRIAVYVPMSYQIGGFTIIVPNSAIRPVEMSMEQAMRFVFTAGMATRRPDSET